MSGQQHVLLRPFDEVVKYARLVNQQAAAYPYSIADENLFKNPMAVSAQSLLKEGERALRRLTPLIENPSSHLSQHLRTLMLNNGKSSDALLLPCGVRRTTD